MAETETGTSDPHPVERESHSRGRRFLALLLLGIGVVVGIDALMRWMERDHPSSAPDGGIRAVLDSQVAAWNRGDLDGFMNGYWRDPNLTFTSGDKVNRGWEETRKRYLDKYWAAGMQPQDRGQLAFEDLQVESLSPTAAVVRGRYVLTRGGGSDTGRFTLVFRKFAAEWKITSDHTSAGEKKQ